MLATQKIYFPDIKKPQPEGCGSGVANGTV